MLLHSPPQLKFWNNLTGHLRNFIFKCINGLIDFDFKLITYNRQNLPAPAGTFSCSHARCYTCSFLNSSTSISGPKSNFVIRHNFTCTSSNIIYCISCIKCCKLYIGETGRHLSDRFAEHLHSVRNNDVDKTVRDGFSVSQISHATEVKSLHKHCAIT